MPDTTTIICGNLTDAPELKFTPNGAAVANFRVAVTPRVREGDTWKDGETSFFRVNAWRQLAENATESLSKGDRVIVVGRLKARSWETPEDRGGGDRPVAALGDRQARARHLRRRLDLEGEVGRAVQR